MPKGRLCHVRGNGQITLPASLRRLAGVQEGDPLHVQVREDGSLVLRPVVPIDRLELDLIDRLETEDPRGHRDERGLNLRSVAFSATRKLDRLVERLERGQISRRDFIGQAMALGIPPSSIATLLTGQAEQSPEVSRPIATAKSGTPRSRMSVRLTQAFQSLLYLPLYVARDAGFFDEEDIEVEVANAGGGPEAWSTVAAGVADYSIHDPVFAVKAFERGLDAIVVGAICNGLAILAAAQDPEVKHTSDPRQFMTETINNKMVATQPEPDSQWAVLNYLGFLYDVRMGDQYRNLQVPIGTEMEPVLTGNADVGTSFPPAADIALAKGLHELFDFSRFFGPFALSCLCTRRAVIQAFPERHRALINAFEKACQFAYAFPEETMEIAVGEFPGEDPDVIRQAARRCLRRGFVPEHVYVDSEAWRESQTVHKFIGSLERFYDRVEVVDNEAALNAYRSLGRLGVEWDERKPEAATRFRSTKEGESNSSTAVV